MGVRYEGYSKYSGWDIWDLCYLDYGVESSSIIQVHIHTISYQLLLKKYYSLQLTIVEHYCIRRPEHYIFK